MQQPFLTIKDVSHAYERGTSVLKDINLSVPEGAVYSIIGPTGDGKTTLLNVISGVISAPTKGSVVLAGRVLNSVPIEKRGVGVVFQHPTLFTQYSVLDNIALGPRYRLHMPVEQARMIAREWAAKLGVDDLLEVRLDKGRMLSGGQQQRVALARVLASQPTLLLLDEPLSSLHETLARELRSMVSAFVRSQGITALWVAHDQEEAFTVADNVVVMHKGRVEQCGTPRELIENPTSFTKSFVTRFARVSADGAPNGPDLYSGSPFMFDPQGRLVPFKECM